MARKTILDQQDRERSLQLPPDGAARKPQEVLSQDLWINIFLRLAFQERVRTLPLVCKEWCQLAKAPSQLWTDCYMFQGSRKASYKASSTSLVLRLVKHHGLAISKFELESLGARNPRYGWSRKGFAGLVKALPKLTHLRVSDLQSCALSLKPLLSLQGLTALVLSIQVERPSITYDLGCLSHLKNLRRLMFDVVQHTGTVHLSGSLSKLDRLSALHFGLMGRGTSGTGVMDIVRNMAILHELSLTGKLFRKIDLAGITSLRSLDLALPLATADWNIPLEEQLLPLLHMPYLSSLTLDQVPDKTSYVSWHTIWQSLRSVPELRNIKVCDTDLSMLEDEDWIFGTQLKNLTLAACQLERFPMALLDMTNLSSLALYHNALPNLPAGSYLQQLTMLDLSYNSMEDIPAALVLCSSLKSLTWDSMDDDGVCWDRAILKGLLPDGCELHEDD